MSLIEHFIITRFNLRAERPGPERHERPDAPKQLNVAWLTRRFELFDRFCYPTVWGQTRQDFRWLVLFDQETPEPIRARIEALRHWPAFVPVFVPAGQDQQARKAVEAHLSGRPDLLVTTRLDNDDGISRTFVEDLRRRIDASISAPTVLEFPVGYVWHNDRAYLDRQTRNPFSTLVEPLGLGAGAPFRTIYAGSHHDVERLGRVVVASDRPSWVQVIHDDNRCNRLRGIRRPISELAGAFDIDVRLLSERENSLLMSIDQAASTVRAGLGAARAAARDRLQRWRAA